MKFKPGDYVRIATVNEYIDRVGLAAEQNSIEVVEMFGNEVYVVEGYRYDNKVWLMPAPGSVQTHRDVREFAWPEILLDLWHEDKIENEIAMTDFEKMLGENQCLNINI